MGAALVLASAAICGSVPVAAASSSDAQATHAYLIAQYKLVTALLHDAAATRGAESAAAAQIARECPGVVSGMPKEPPLAPFPPPPRVRGENARLTQQKQTIEEELDAAVGRPGDSLNRSAEEAYAAEVRQLSWSNPAITAALKAATTARLEAVSAAAPSFCADARAWAQSGYRVLSAASREFEASRAARRNSDQGGRFTGHAAEALRERIGSSADPQYQGGRNQTPCQRECHLSDAFQLGSNRRVPASRDQRTQADHSGPRAHRRRYSLRSELRVRPAGRWALVIDRRRWHTAGRALPKC